MQGASCARRHRQGRANAQENGRLSYSVSKCLALPKDIVRLGVRKDRLCGKLCR
jgi:hypothetical protein